MRPEPFRVWKPRRISVKASRSVGDMRQFSYKGTISLNTSSASSINISLISGSASLASAGSCSVSGIKGASTAGTSRSNKDTVSPRTSVSAVSIPISSDAAASLLCDAATSAATCTSSASISASAPDSVSEMANADSLSANPASIGCPLNRLRLCKIVIAGSTLGGRFA